MDTSHYKGNTSTSSIGVYYWNNSTNTNIWSASNLNTVNLNTNYVTNIGSEWSNLIVEHTWQVGGGRTSYLYNSPVKTAYNHEVGANKVNTTYPAKIGLMYVSDYGYAASPENWQTTLYSYDNNTNRNNNWMFMGLPEWTISRRSDLTDGAFSVYGVGHVGYDRVNLSIYVVRPTFYLASNVAYESGTGTNLDPIRLKID